MAETGRERRSGRGAVAMPMALALAFLLVPLGPPSEAGAPAPAGTVSDEAPPPQPDPVAAADSGSAPTGLPTDPALATIRRELERTLESRNWRNSRWSVLAVSGATGDTLFSHAPDETLAPASNVKLVTSAAALFHLGPDYRFPTFLLSDGRVEDGVLRGDLVLYGGGDPALSDRFYDRGTEPLEILARQLRERGIHEVDGDLVGDASYFHGPGRPDSWEARYLNDWFAAPVSALSVNESVVTLRISPAGEAGVPPRIRTDPEGARIPVDNQATTVAGAPSTPLMVDREDPDGPIRIRGEIRLGDRDRWRRMTVSDPPLVAASLLERALEAEGIRVNGGVRTVTVEEHSLLDGPATHAPALSGDRGPRVLAVHHSPPVQDLLPVVNRRSHNLYSEHLFRAVGRVALGDASFDGGARAAQSYLEERVGVPPGSVDLADGSGLSRSNRASASALIRTLAHLDSSEHAEVFWASMPTAGNSRELRRMYRTPAAGNLQAKTGTIRRVSSLTGRVRDADGEVIHFSIVANDVPSSNAAKRVEDEIGARLAAFRRAAPTRTAREAPAPAAEREEAGEAGRR